MNTSRRFAASCWIDEGMIFRFNEIMANGILSTVAGIPMMRLRCSSGPTFGSGLKRAGGKANQARKLRREDSMRGGRGKERNGHAGDADKLGSLLMRRDV